MAIGAISGGGGYAAMQAQRAGAAGALTPEEQQEVQKLRRIDQKVRQHEAAHSAAGAGLTGGTSYEYVRGPDGRQYAVSGEVKIDVSPAQTPEQTIEKAKRIQAAALAPADPSAQDRAVAAQAAQMAAKAQAELSQAKNQERLNGDDGKNAGQANPASAVRSEKNGETSSENTRESRAVAAYNNLEPQPESLLSLFA